MIQHYLAVLQRYPVCTLPYLIMSTVAETAGDVLALPAEVLNMRKDEPAVYDKIQFNGKPAFTDKAYAL